MNQIIYDKARKRAREKLPCLMKLHKNKCFWCQKPIIMVRTVQKKYKIIKQDHNTVTFIKNNQEVTELKASVDHIKELANGGNNSILNLVPSCFPCNDERSKNEKNKLARMLIIENESERVELSLGILWPT